MSFTKKMLGVAAVTAASIAYAGAAKAEVCNTPSSMGDLGKFEGEVITIAGSMQGKDEENLLATVSCFEQATGAVVKYSGSRDFAALIVADLQSNNAPNVAIFPQPGLAGDMAKEGYLSPLGDDLENWMVNNYGAGQSWVDLGTYTGQDGNKAFYGFAFKQDLKSLVWYSPEQFEDNGYEIPTTMEDLIALSDQMVADGNTPWCIGIESGNATGWTATDWMEDLMLRTASPKKYDQWVSNELPFNSPEVLNAMEIWGKFSRNDDYVAGGSAAVATTFFGDAPKGLFTSPAQCMMHRQASFIPAFFPNKGEEVAAGEADFFYFPPFKDTNLKYVNVKGNPVLGAGTLYTITKDSPATRAFFEYLTEAKAHEVWMSQGAFLTAHKGADLSAYASAAQRKQGEILVNASTFRFDASDLMPGAIGAGAFWSEMTAFANGQDAQTTADNIQAAWDAIK
ncbi:MAG: ABC transporter substrate-binding protein [Candidatus Puniceispirillaceae bacterium]